MTVPTDPHDWPDESDSLLPVGLVAEGGLVPGQVMPGQDCKGDAGVSDFPYHVFRTSDDIYNHWGTLPPVSSVLLPLR